MNTPLSENQASNVLPNHLTQAHQTQDTSTPQPQPQLPETPSQNDTLSRVMRSDMSIEESQDVQENDENNYSETEEQMYGDGLSELENNRSIDQYGTEPPSVARDSQRDYQESLDDFEEEKTQISGRSGSRAAATSVNKSSILRDKSSHINKSKAGKKSTTQGQSYPLKKSNTNKIGKNPQNLFKKSFGKNNKMAASVNGNSSFMLPGDVPKKKYAKTPIFKTYNELVQTLLDMEKFDWIEACGINTKAQLLKQMSPHALWFMICANYFPKHAFTHKNNKENVHHKLEGLKSYSFEVPQRLPKDCIKNDNIEPHVPTESDNAFLASLSKGVKQLLDAYKSADYNKKVVTSRAANTYEIPEYTAKDAEWTIETKRYILDNFQNLQEQGFIDEYGQHGMQNPGLLSKIDLQDLMTLYEKDYYDLAVENEITLKELEKEVGKQMIDEEYINKLHFDNTDSLADLRLKFPENTVFISLLEKKKNEIKDVNGQPVGEGRTGGEQARKSSKSSKSVNVSSKSTKTVTRAGINNETEAAVEDSVCQVCNGEDYNDDDLIVFCARCNISVHQKCYGIPTVPHDDWICDLCQSFQENGRYLRCPLCTKRGGAMKPTNLRADCTVFENQNQPFHNWIKSYARPELFKNLPKRINPPVVKPKGINPEDIDLHKIPGDENYLEHLYYNFHTINFDFSEEELKNEPKPPFVWAHITCATFIPELYFSDDEHKSTILGIERIDRQRFKYECLVCKKSGHGAIINCGKDTCKKAFHPECARRSKYSLEIKDTETGFMLFYIFCKKHTPLKLKRILESKENKIREDIDRFFKTIDKQYMNFLAETQQLSILNDQSQQKDPSKKISIKNKLNNMKDDRGYFMKLVEKYRMASNEIPCSITVKWVPHEWNANLYEISDITLPRPALKPDRKLTPEDIIWSVMPYKNLTPEQKYDKYRKILIRLKKKQDYNKAAAQRQKAMPPPAHVPIHEIPLDIFPAEPINEEDFKVCLGSAFAQNGTQEFYIKEDLEPTEPTYCLCQRVYSGELMIACEICEGWYHPQCVGVPIDYDFEKVKWWCLECSQKKGYDNPVYMVEGEYEVKQAAAESINQKRANNFKVDQEPNYPMKKIKGI